MRRISICCTSTLISLRARAPLLLTPFFTTLLLMKHANSIRVRERAIFQFYHTQMRKKSSRAKNRWENEGNFLESFLICLITWEWTVMYRVVFKAENCLAFYRVNCVSIWQHDQVVMSENVIFCEEFFEVLWLILFNQYLRLKFKLLTINVFHLPLRVQWILCNECDKRWCKKERECEWHTRKKVNVSHLLGSTTRFCNLKGIIFH